MVNRLSCPRCGNLYLLPPREGSYLCPVCRHLLPRQREPLSPSSPARRGRGALLVLGACFLTAAGTLSVREPRATSAAVSAAPVESEQTLGYPIVRVDAARVERAVRAYHRRELRARPTESQPHAWAAYDRLRELLDDAQRALPLSSAPTNAPISEYSRQRQLLDERQLQWEKQIARHRKEEVEQAVQHALKALEYAESPQEELQARRILADAYRFAGRYDDSIRQFSWLASIEPYGDRGGLMRCFAHKGLEVRWENRDGDYWVIAGGRAWPIGVRTAEPYIEATQKWLRRWPRSSFLRSRLGSFYYSRATQEATQHPDFPRPGREFGRRVDAFIWRHARPWVEAGMQEYQAAVDLAEDPADRARALTELGHGSLFRADYDRAIALLRAALALEPWNRAAQDYLRQAYRRRGAGQGRVVTTSRPPGGWLAEGYGLPPLNASAVGYGFRSPQLSPEQAAEVKAILSRLRPGTPPRFVTVDPARALADRNRLDALIPGTGTRYRRETGDVLAVDLEHAVARLRRMEALGMLYPR